MADQSAGCVVWGDRKVGERFLVHCSANDWLPGQKIDRETFRKEDGREIKVSYWTKTVSK